MNLKTWIPLVLAVVLGLIAMKVARDVVAKNKNNAPTTSGREMVIVNKDLQPGAQLTPADLSTAKVAGEMASEAVFSNPADLDGRVIMMPAMKGSPVLQTLLAPKGVQGGLQGLIPEGMRAITIEINEFSGVAGNLTVGCRVDVIATINGEAGEMLSRTVVQNVRVQGLGTRQQVAGTPNEAQQGPVRSVTLLATPKEAEAIELAAATSRPRLVLRASNDNETTHSEGVSAAELRRATLKHDPFIFQQVELLKGGTPSTQPTEMKSSPRQRQVKIIRGGIETEVYIPEIAQPVGPKWISGASGQELPTNK